MLGLALIAALLAQGIDPQTPLRRAEEAVRQAPGSAEAHARLGMAYQDVGKLPEAVQALEKALQLDPRLPRVGILLAFSYLPLGKYREAVPYLEQALEKEEDVAMRVTAGERLVECYFALGEEENGLIVVQKLRRLAPDDPDVLYTASKVYTNLWNGAVERLLEKAPGSYRLHQVLAEVYETQEKYADAAKEYREILRLEPRLPGAHYRLGRMLQRTDNAAEALAEFQTELKTNPADVPTLVEIGEIELKAGRSEPASRYFSRAVEVTGSYAPARVGLAKALLAQKQFQKAAEQLEQARKLAPSDETIPYNLMIAYRSLGRMEDSRRALAEFQRLKKDKDQKLSSIRSRLKGVPVQ